MEESASKDEFIPSVESSGLSYEDSALSLPTEESSLLDGPLLTVGSTKMDGLFCPL